MPVYTIQLPDGRTMDAEATSQEEALAGAQAWYAEQGQKPTVTAPEPAAAATPAPVTAAPAEDWTPPSAAEEMSTPRANAPLSNLTDMAQKAAQGVSFRWGDEMAAGAGALPNILTGGRYGKPYQEILDEVRGREKAFEEREPAVAGISELAGSLAGAGTAGLGLVSRLPAAVPGFVRAGLASMPLGAAQSTGEIEGPASIADYGTEAAKGAATSGLIGTATAGLGNALGHVAGPVATEAAQRLHRFGVRLTPGELLGGTMNRLEDTAASLPIIGDMVRARGREGVESLNRATYQEVTAPLGPRYQGIFNRANTEVGHESVDAIHDLLERRYDRVVPRMRAELSPQADPRVLQEVNAIAARLPQAALPEFRDMVHRYVDTVADPSTMTLTGRALQQSLRSLRTASERFQRSTASPYHVDLGDALADLRTTLEGSMARHSARRDVTAYGNINASYARYARLRDAASRVTSEEGVFSPANLHGSVRAADRSVGKGQMARGRALLQNLSDPARAVMKSKGAGSPSAERIAIIGAITNPALAAKTLLYGVPALGLYTRAGNRAFQRLATSAPYARLAIRNAAVQGSNAAAPAAADLYEDNQ